MEKMLANQQITDPFGREICADSDEILTANRGLENAIARYQLNPWMAKRIFLFVICLDLLIFSFFAILSLKSGIAGELITEIVLLPVLPCVYYYGILSPIQADYMRLLLAYSVGWLYRSGSERVDKELYISPEKFFRKGVPEILRSQF